jgi:iron(III) transport system ATP-binding protein
MGDANHCKGVLKSTNGDLGHVLLGSVELTLPHRDLPQGDIDVIIRPESMVLCRAGDANTLPATVATATYMGSHAEYNFDTEVGRLFAVDQTGGASLRTPGEKLGLRFGSHGVLVVRP